MQAVKGYIASLFDRELIPTGLRTAAFVGTMLFAINHGPALVRGNMDRERWLSAIATYIMPYLVSVYGQYSYRRKLKTRSMAAQRDLDTVL